MDLSNLRWIKNIRDQQNRLAYVPSRQAEVSMELPEAKIFGLAWKIKSKDNAGKPKEGDLIILHQKATVTHIVKVLDNQVYVNREFQNEDDYSVYRVVRAIWTPPEHLDWSNLPHQNDILDFKYDIYDGDVHSLTDSSKLPLFQKRWGDKSLESFQNWVSEQLQQIT